jgi:DNA-binding MurR/RpiR family transcriptional regulator
VTTGDPPRPPARVLVCGSREWGDVEAVRRRIADLPETTVIVTGGARGVDRIAEEAARDLGRERMVFRARWDVDGRSASTDAAAQNGRALDSDPDLVIAFRAGGESPGTDDCIAQARRRGIPVEVIEPTR